MSPRRRQARSEWRQPDLFGTLADDPTPSKPVSISAGASDGLEPVPNSASSGTELPSLVSNPLRAPDSPPIKPSEEDLAHSDSTHNPPQNLSAPESRNLRAPCWQKDQDAAARTKLSPNALRRLLLILEGLEDAAGERASEEPCP